MEREIVPAASRLYAGKLNVPFSNCYLLIENPNGGSIKKRITVGGFVVFRDREMKTLDCKIGDKVTVQKTEQ